jgi:hypothetical protein
MRSLNEYVKHSYRVEKHVNNSKQNNNEHLDAPSYTDPPRPSSPQYPTLPLTSPTLFAPITGSYDNSSQGYHKLPGELVEQDEMLTEDYVNHEWVKIEAERKARAEQDERRKAEKEAKESAGYCHTCGEMGHMKHDCPNKGGGRGGGNVRSGGNGGRGSVTRSGGRGQGSRIL